MGTKIKIGYLSGEPESTYSKHQMSLIVNKKIYRSESNIGDKAEKRE